MADNGFEMRYEHQPEINIFVDMTCRSDETLIVWMLGEPVSMLF